jgi:hypothetical protein
MSPMIPMSTPPPRRPLPTAPPAAPTHRADRLPGDVRVGDFVTWMGNYSRVLRVVEVWPDERRAMCSTACGSCFQPTVYEFDQLAHTDQTI